MTHKIPLPPSVIPNKENRIDRGLDLFKVGKKRNDIRRDSPSPTLHRTRNVKTDSNHGPRIGNIAIKYQQSGKGNLSSFKLTERASSSLIKPVTFPFEQL
jgi:hypothetical protein